MTYYNSEFNRKVFLEDLPRYTSGVHNKKINWNKCIGYKVSFIYDDINGEIEIIDYGFKPNYLRIRYNDREININTSGFKKCSLGNLLMEVTKEFKIKINENIKDENRDLTIYKRYTKNKWKIYDYICNKCGYKGSMIEENLLKGCSCSCCCNPPKVVVQDINSMWKTNYWMVELGVNEEWAKTHTSQSNEKAPCKCPHCGKEIYKTCYSIYRDKSIGCSCSDKKSYISKYILSVINQLNADFKTEVKYNWNKYTNPKNKKKSQASIDFVIYYNGREIPLEADGEFHRKDNKMNGVTKEQVEYIDKQRDDNCLKYLGEETIRITDEGDVKENILNSKLNELYDLSIIDWNKCEKFALSNLVKEVCNYWNQKEEWETATNLAIIFNLSRVTILKYLKKGNKLGWCTYCAEDFNGKKQIEVYKNEKLIGIFESISKLSDISAETFGVKLNTSNISAVCLGNRKQHKGFVFKYAC